jgi:hypothetical protein
MRSAMAPQKDDHAISLAAIGLWSERIIVAGSMLLELVSKKLNDILEKKLRLSIE